MRNISPAGHSKGITSRIDATGYASLAGDLERAYALWLGNYSYTAAHSLLCKIRPRTIDLHCFLLENHSSLHELTGTFITAGYNLSDEDIITYDFDIPLHMLGYRLPRHKLLVNRGTLEEGLGWKSEGVIVNCGNTKWGFGFDAEGIIINAGHTGPSFGGRRNRIEITLREPVSYVTPSGTRIRPDNLPCRLKEYTEELVELCQGPTERIYKRYGNNPSTTIQHDIRRLLKENKQ